MRSRQRLARSGEQRPTLPTWLKDYNSAIRSEDERLGRLGDLVMAWEAGTYADLDIDIVKYCGVQGEHTNPLVVFHNHARSDSESQSVAKGRGTACFLR